jgi:SAM-dependent methyltransferase
MSTPGRPFTDAAVVRGALYATAGRLARRTAALHAAKVSGADAAATIADLAAESTPAGPVVCDVGCGRGTTTLRLAARLSPARLVALDQSPALLAVVRDRLAEAGGRVETVRADFHHLPLAAASLDVVVAAFCLYHSPRPARVVAQIARCLSPGGRAVLVTKSADSYHQIDRLVAQTGLDPQARERPSLYATFHSDTIAEITATALRLTHLLQQRHVFRFDGLDHLAAYLATSPKYRLPAHLAGDAAGLAEELRRRTRQRRLTATSTLTYAVAVRP